MRVKFKRRPIQTAILKRQSGAKRQKGAFSYSKSVSLALKDFNKIRKSFVYNIC